MAAKKEKMSYDAKDIQVLEGFVRSPTFARVGVAVDSYYMVKNFQNVMELHLEA